MLARSLFASERDQLTSLEQEVLRSLRKHELLSSSVDAAFEQAWTPGERLAGRIASFGGSWFFLAVFGVFLALWIGANSVVFLWRPVDPYPFILLNLVLSCRAAVQVPIVVMSQNRQEAKDRLRARHDYQVNLKAELEIRQLHETVDHLLSHPWERLVQIRELQLELLPELGRSGRGAYGPRPGGKVTGRGRPLRGRSVHPRGRTPARSPRSRPRQTAIGDERSICLAPRVSGGNACPDPPGARNARPVGRSGSAGRPRTRTEKTEPHNRPSLFSSPSASPAGIEGRPRRRVDGKKGG